MPAVLETIAEMRGIACRMEMFNYITQFGTVIFFSFGTVKNIGFVILFNNMNKPVINLLLII